MKHLLSRKLIFAASLCIVIFISILLMSGALATMRQSPRIEHFQTEIAAIEESIKISRDDSEIQALENQLEQYGQMATLVSTFQPTFASIDALEDTRSVAADQRKLTLRAYETEGAKLIPTGIVWDAVHASFLPNNYIIGNAWYGRLGNKLIQVYAGAMGNDSKQGAVIASVASDYAIGIYITPTKNGLLRIIGEKDLVLTLESEDGTLFYFNVLGHTFVLDPDQVVPTITPVTLATKELITLTPETSNPYPQP